MTPLQNVISCLGTAALIALLVGLFRRSRHPACYFFTVYACVVLVGSIPPRIDPDRFSTWDFYLQRDGVQALPKVGIAVELARRIFSVVPRGLCASPLADPDRIGSALRCRPDGFDSGS